MCLDKGTAPERSGFTGNSDFDGGCGGTEERPAGGVNVSAGGICLPGNVAPDCSGRERKQEYIRSGDGMVFEPCPGSSLFLSGRWFEKDVGGARCAVTTNTGSEIYFRVSGTESVSLLFARNTAGNIPLISYCADGDISRMPRLPADAAVIPLPDCGEHVVRVVIDAMDPGEKKWDEAAGAAVMGADAGKGRVEGLRPLNGVIAFYGDSITEGDFCFGLEWTVSSYSAVHTYAWQAAARLRALPYVCGYGSSGITAGGFFRRAIEAVDSMSSGYADPGPADPRVVVTNYGANDRDASDGEFLDGYRALLDRLHAKHPRALILALAPFCQVHAAQVRQAAEERGYARFADTSSWDLSYTDGLHPTPEGAEKAGALLAEEIARAVGNGDFSPQV